MIKKIKFDIMLAEDTITDNNNIGFLMIIGHFFRTLKLVIMIFNISYFFGITFMIIAEISKDLSDKYSDQEYFLDYF